MVGDSQDIITPWSTHTAQHNADAEIVQTLNKMYNQKS